MKKTIVLAFVISPLLFACVSKTVHTQQWNNRQTFAENRLSLLTFNVENLFDTNDDPDKNDEAFLPLAKKRSEVMQNKCRVQNQFYQDKKKSQDLKGKLVGLEQEEDGMQEFFTQFRVNECLNKDWSERVLARKMTRLTDVLKQVNDGLGPDILILQEIENEAVLRTWRDKYLNAMNYQTLVLIEGPDERGIDTAILSRLPQAEPAKLHTVNFSKFPEIDVNDRRPTRGILESRLRLPNGDTIAVFSVHFPSQGASSAHRRAAAQTLLDVTATIPKDIPIVVGGDFNITAREEWKKRYFRDLLGKEFAVSFLVGLADVPGSTYYKYDQTWSFFDVLLFSKPLMDESSAWRLDTNSLRLINSSVYQTDQDGKPAKFRDGYASVGVSDHWPVYAELRLKHKQKLGAN